LNYTIGDDAGDDVITITLQDNGLGDDIMTGADSVIDNQGGPGNPIGRGALAFPNLYVGLAAALGAGVLAYLLRRRVNGRNMAEM
jgi:hypothetical protein